jgi:CheY-like chemotaxis protein
MRILILEDDAVTSSMLRRLLEREGHIVIVAGTGEDAVTRAAIHWPELVISDFQLPGTLNGAEACSLIRAFVPSARVIMMTGLPLDLVRPRCAVARPIAILQKPLECESLLKLIEGMV